MFLAGKTTYCHITKQAVCHTDAWLYWYRNIKWLSWEKGGAQVGEFANLPLPSEVNHE